jgi:hypothetical protein
MLCLRENELAENNPNRTLVIRSDVKNPRRKEPIAVCSSSEEPVAILLHCIPVGRGAMAHL